MRNCLIKDPNLPEYYRLFMGKRVLMCPGIANVFFFRYRQPKEFSVPLTSLVV